jgi:CDP-glucose 4,6-dehydratase
MGTAHVLEAVRHQSSVKACVVITSDKCYATASQAHKESDPFGGDDLYSASKGAAEIVIHAYRESFFRRSGIPVASARAGNIVGGGDWAEYRIVPDSVRAIQAGESVRLRNPAAIRPWQHVLDAIAGYLRLGDALVARGDEVAEGWNFGPHPDATVTVEQLVRSLITNWRNLGGKAKDPTFESEVAISERDFLTLISSKAEARLGWRSLLNFESTMEWTAEWYFKANSREGATVVTDSQIARFLQLDVSGNESNRLVSRAGALPASAPRD